MFRRKQSPAAKAREEEQPLLSPPQPKEEPPALLAPTLVTSFAPVAAPAPVAAAKTDPNPSTSATFHASKPGPAPSTNQRILESSLSPEEGFIHANGYSWDWVLVLPVEPREGSTPSLQPFEIIPRLQKGGMQTYLYYSVQRDEIYCKIRASVATLKKHADVMEHIMLLDEEQLRDACENGVPKREIEPVSITHDPTISPLTPYQYIYSTYEMEEDKAYLFKNAYPLKHPFSAMHRLKIIAHLIDTTLTQGSGKVAFKELLHDGSILGSLPLHDEAARARLAAKWITVYGWPWEQPVNDIKDYFGEKIGLCCLFLGHYSTWLLGLSVLGFGVFLDVCGEDFNTEAASVPFFSVFVSFWCVLMLEFWKRSEAETAMIWGMSRFEEVEEDRDAFYGMEIKSYIDGSEIKYFPHSERHKKMYTSTISIIWMILLVIAAVIGVFWMQIDFSNSGGFLESYGSTICSLVNSVQIQILNAVYSKIAVSLTNRENHRTNTDYEDSLIGKLFCFQFVNSYASLFYVAYIKNYTVGCSDGSCMNELCITLGIIFVTRLVTSNLLELLMPRITYAIKLKKETEGVAPGVTLSRPEREYIMPTFDLTMGPLTEYANLSVQFGYVILFVTAFPLAPLLAYVSNHLAIRTTASKLLYFYRRALPSGAQDIGTWETILYATAIAAVITNAGIICFTMDVLDSYSSTVKVWLFFGIQYGVFAIMGLFSYIVPDVPDYVEIQLARQDFLIEHLIKAVKDVEVDVEPDSERVTLTVNDVDDVVLKKTYQ